MEFEGKRAVVTGAASGIGAAVTRLLVRAGARVVAADIAQSKLEALAEELGASVMPHLVDLSLRPGVEAMVQAAVEAFGGLDILVNNAGIGAFARAGDLDPEIWRKVLAIDLDAVFYASRIALPHLIESQGNIVCTASISGMGADFGFTAYNAAKAGVLALVRNMAIDYAARGVRVNAVSPGFTLTALTEQMPPPFREAYADNVPMKRAGTPEEIAEAIVFLASGRASYITGQNLTVDGGLTAWTGQPNTYDLIHQMTAGAQ